METSASLSQEDIDSYEYDYNHFSAALRKRATHAIEGYMNVKFDVPSDIEHLIYNRHEIVSGHSWDHLVSGGRDANNVQIWEHDSNGGCFPKHDNPHSCGGHAILIIGYDKINKRYLAKNSYRAGSNYWIPYYKDNGVDPVLHNGVTITDVRPVESGPQKEARWIGEWKMDHNGFGGKLVIRRTVRSANEHNRYKGNLSTPLVDISTPPRIGTYYTANNVRHPVYGETENNGKKLVIYIDFNTSNNSYSDQVGDVTGQSQRFDFYQFEDADLAAGVTYLIDDQRYGAFLARPYMEIDHTFSLTPPQPEDWLKFWSINVGDQWSGILQITSVASGQVEGQFFQNGTSYTIDGYPVGNRYLFITIYFDGGATQYLNLYYHEWENDFISGVTQAGDGLYAVPYILVIP